MCRLTGSSLPTAARAMIRTVVGQGGRDQLQHLGAIPQPDARPHVSREGVLGVDDVVKRKRYSYATVCLARSGATITKLAGFRRQALARLAAQHTIGLLPGAQGLAAIARSRA